VVPVDGEAA
jgi:hypothetical protein